MTRESQRMRDRDTGMPKAAPERRSPRDAPSQGIVRDERGQEQPADKERAQRASKSE